MYIGLCYEGKIKGEFMFSPLFEMLAALHVIGHPEHHLARAKWMEKMKKEVDEEVLQEIKKIGELTNEWLILMDFAHTSPYEELDILDALLELEKLSLYQWNKVFKPYDKSINNKQKEQILTLLRNYYSNHFQKEIKFLQPFITRILKKEVEKCKEEGLFECVNAIHERIEVNETEIVLHKNKEYHFHKNAISKIVITGSTFMSPHLLMGGDKATLYLTKLIVVEDKKETVPQDLAQVLKALADETRLRILREINKTPESTQSLALKLNITEAGISKQLKVLLQAGVVSKVRKGNYMYYYLNKEYIDFIPYKIYEYIV